MLLQCLLLLTAIPFTCQAVVSDQCALSFALSSDVQRTAALSCPIRGATDRDADWRLQMLAAIGARANERTHGMMTRSKKRRKLLCVAAPSLSVAKPDPAPKKEQPPSKRVPRLAQRGRRQRKIVYRNIPVDYKPVSGVDYDRHSVNRHLGWCVCRHCGQLLRGMTSMKHHLNVHVKFPNRAYHCRYCNASFVQSSHRSVHEKNIHCGFD